MDNKIACLDADVIIKMSRDDIGLLEKVVEDFDKCFLHKCVYDEVEWSEESIEILDRLISEDRILLITDENLFDRLEFKELFMSSLQQACEIFAIDYEEIYSGLEIIIEDKDRILEEIKKVDQNVEGNLGETRTLQMIILFRDIEEENVNYFVSADRRARRGIILSYGSTLTGQKNFGLSLISIFSVLKEKDMPMEDALEFVKKFQSDKSKVYLQNKNMSTISNIEIIKKLYKDELKLLNIGEFQLK